MREDVVVTVRQLLFAFVLACSLTLAFGAGAAFAAPSNDNFANAQAISGATGLASGTNVGATEEIGEPNIPWNDGGASVWYAWTAPSNGYLLLDTFGSDFDTLLGVFTGPGVGALTTIASNDQAVGTSQSQTTAKVTGGVVYYIAVDGYANQSDADTGQIVLHWAFTPAPANDSFASAQTLATNDGTLTGSSLGARKETGEPNHAGDAGGSSVWYSFTAPANGGVVVDTFGSGFDTGLSVYTGSNVASLTALANNQDYDYGAGMRTSRVVFRVTGGTPYKIAVDGKGGAMGGITLHWHFGAPPANDNWANRVALGANDGTLTGSNLGATRETGEPVFGGWGPGRSVWYSWTAPRTGVITLDTAGSDYNTLIELSTGTSVTALTEIANNNDYGGTKQSRIASAVTSGTTYHFGVDGSGADGGGNFVLHWHFAGLMNDNLADAETLNGNEGTVTGSTLAATKETDEPSHGNWFGYGNASIWYEWTAPGNGALMVDTAGSDFNTLLSAYTGSAYGSLHLERECAAKEYCGAATSRLAFPVTGGTTYLIAVDAYRSAFGAARGNAVLHWRFRGTPPANDSFALSQTLGTTEGTVTGSTLDATSEAGEPDHAWQQAYASVWYSWTAPTDTVVEIGSTGLGSGFDTRLGVYTGGTVGALTLVAQANDAVDGPERVVVHATTGTEYLIAVDGVQNEMGYMGDFVLHWQTYPPPANDDFADAQGISGESGTVDGSNIGAGKESGEPNIVWWDSGGASIWYAWTAPRSGTVTFDTNGSGVADPMIGAYAGSSVASLTAIAVDGGNEISFDATDGVTYKIAADGEEGASGDFVINWEMAPEYDNFSSAHPLTGNSGTWEGSNDGATRESGEPNHAGYTGGSSLWFSFTAVTTGTVTVDTNGTGFDTLLGVYTGLAVDALAEITSDDDSGENRCSKAPFAVEPGTTYWIAVDGYLGATGGVAMHWGFQTAPTNDRFASSQQLTGTEGTVTGTTVGASREAGEPNHEGTWPGASIWYRWQAPANGALVVDTFGSPIDTVLSAYTGSGVAGLTPVAGSGDFRGAAGWIDDCRVSFEVTAGVTYRMAVDVNDFWEDAGATTLHWRFHPAAISPNNNFPSEITITGASGTAAGETFLATKEPSEPNHGGNGGGASIWYAWTAPGTGGLVLDTDGSDFDTLLGIYTGSGVTTLTTIGGDNDLGNGNCSRVSARVTAGQLYHMAIDGHEGTRGYTKLNWRFTPGPPANDNFSSAISLLGDDGTLTASNAGASKESTEPNHAGNSGGASIWYRYTALADGALEIDTVGSDFDTLLGVYTGSTVPSLTAVASNENIIADGQSRVAFRTTLGRIYQIAVDGNWGRFGSAALHWHFRTAPPNDNFSAAQAIGGEDGTVTGNNLAASSEPTEPWHAGFAAPVTSIWYAWTAPANGLVSFDTYGSDFSTVLGIYRGSSLSALTVVARAAAWGDDRTLVTFPARAGETYMVAADRRPGGWNPGTGSLVTHWHMAVAPANDDFAAAEALDSSGGLLVASNAGATKETSEPAHAGNAGGASLWYAWTAPADGTFSVDTLDSGLDTLLGVYTGTSVGALTRVASNDDGGGSPDQSSLSIRATSGTTYRVAVDGKNGARDNFTLQWRFAAGGGAPANDDFSSAQALGGAYGTLQGSNVGASRETSEPEHAGDHGRASVWYGMTPSSDCTMVIDSFGSDFDTLLGVYVGTDVGSLARVADSDDAGGRVQGRVIFGAVGGQQYKIAVDGKFGQSGTVKLNWGMPPPPANDHWRNAQNLMETAGSVSGTNLGATKESGEPTHAASEDAEGVASVWYKWTAPAGDTLIVETAGSDFDTVLGVYTGTTVTALSEVTCDDDSGPGSASRAEIAVATGTTYYIAVDGYSHDDFGNIALGWRTSTRPAPHNDNFASAQVLTETAGSLAGTNLGATKETGEPRHAWVDGGASIWYSWTAPAHGMLTVDTSGSVFNTLLGVYTGDAVDGLTRVSSNDNAGTSLQSTVTFQVAAGRTYRIAVDGYDSATGAVKLNWGFSEIVSSNDDFVYARTLTGTEGTRTDTNENATKEAGEPGHAGNPGGASIWYKWTASSDGTLTLDTFGSDFNTLLGVYAGSNVASLTALVSNDDTSGGLQSSVVLTVTATHTYRIAVDGSDGATGTVSLHYRAAYVPPPVGPVTNFRAAIGSKRVRLTWTKPTTGYAATRVYRSLSRYAANANDLVSQTRVFEASGTATIVTGLTNGRRYYFTAFVRGTQGQWSAAARTYATPNLTYPVLSKPYVPSSVKRLKTFYVTGTCAPAHWQSSTLRLYFYRKVSGRWRYYRYITVTLAASATSYRKGYKLPYRGYWYVKAYHACVDHRVKYSAVRYFAVK